MATASIFQNYVHLVEHKALIIITKQIQEGKYKEQVEAIRKLIAEGQDKEAELLKKQLPAINGFSKNLKTFLTNSFLIP